MKDDKFTKEITKNRWISGLAFVLLLFSMIIVSCSTEKNKRKKPVITVSITPQKYFIEKIAGQTFDINVMVPDGASPATYDPVPVQLQKLSESVAYMKIGYIGFELAWMDKIKETNPEMPVYNLSENITLMYGDHEHAEDHYHSHAHRGIDPHIWMSPKNAKIISENIYHAICELAPARKEQFYKALADFTGEVTRLDLVVQAKLQGKEGKKFIIFHPALTYYARDYSLKQISIEAGGKIPGVRHIKEVIDMALKKDISVIFIQKEFDIENAKVIAKETGADIFRIHPLSNEWKQEILRISNILGNHL
jgi:zinc transport system substrate-binding protein